MKLVLRGSANQIKNALSYLAAIDTEPKQVALELRVMELTKEDALNLGLSWSLLTGGTLQAFNMNQNGPATPTRFPAGSRKWATVTLPSWFRWGGNTTVAPSVSAVASALATSSTPT